jgi:drug/metabolite transporter (DMT)-like permease
MPYLGEIAALSAALCWLGSSMSFAVASRAVGALPTNQFRVVAALPLLFLIAWATVGEPWPTGVPIERIGLLVASGVVGLVIGDYGFFHALATIGPRVASVVLALWPAFTVGLEALAGRLPSGNDLLGIGMTVSGVVLVLLRSREGAWRPGLTRGQWLLGVAGALLGAFGQASGFLLAGLAMAPGPDLPEGVMPLPCTVVRMAAGTVGLCLVTALQRQALALRAVFRERRVLAAALVGVACGPIGGVWLSMIARRHAEDAGVAAALMATTPVFLMPVAIFAYGARVGWLGAFGTLLAVAGVAVCFVA